MKYIDEIYNFFLEYDSDEKDIKRQIEIFEATYNL